MIEQRHKTRRSLSGHASTIDVVQQLLQNLGAKRCAIRQSEFDAVLVQLDDLRKLVSWVERHQDAIRQWDATRKSSKKIE